MESKGEEKAVSPQRSRRNSEPPKKAKVEKSATTTPSLAPAGTDADAAAPAKKSRASTKKRRSAVFDTRELASSLKATTADKDDNADKAEQPDAGAKAGKIRRSVSGSSLKAKIKTTRTTGEVPTAVQRSDSSSSQQPQRTHVRAESGLSDSGSLTNEEINIMGITLTAKAPRGKSKSFRSADKDKAKLVVADASTAAGAEPAHKKSASSSKKKAPTESDVDTSKDKAEGEDDSKRLKKSTKKTDEKDSDDVSKPLSARRDKKDAAEDSDEKPSSKKKRHGESAPVLDIPEYEHKRKDKDKEKTSARKEKDAKATDEPLKEKEKEKHKRHRTKSSPRPPVDLVVGSASDNESAANQKKEADTGPSLLSSGDSISIVEAQPMSSIKPVSIDVAPPAAAVVETTPKKADDKPEAKPTATDSQHEQSPKADVVTIEQPVPAPEAAPTPAPSTPTQTQTPAAAVTPASPPTEKPVQMSAVAAAAAVAAEKAAAAASPVVSPVASPVTQPKNATVVEAQATPVLDLTPVVTTDVFVVPAPKKKSPVLEHTSAATSDEVSAPSSGKGSVSDIIKKFQAATVPEPAAGARQARSSSLNAAPPAKSTLGPSNRGVKVSSHGERRERRGSHSSPSRSALPPKSPDANTSSLESSSEHLESSSEKSSEREIVSAATAPLSVPTTGSAVEAPLPSPPSAETSAQATPSSSETAVPAEAPASAPAMPAPVPPVSAISGASGVTAPSPVRRHSSKDIRLSVMTADELTRNRSGSASLSRDSSRNLVISLTGSPPATTTPPPPSDELSQMERTPSFGIKRSNSSTRERSGSTDLDGVRRSASREGMSDATGSVELVKLKDDLRRYREGYDYYKYKFREAEQWLAKDGLDKFKLEFDEKKRRLRELEESSKKERQQLNEFKMRVNELETLVKSLEERLRKYEPDFSAQLTHSNSLSALNATTPAGRPASLSLSSSGGGATPISESGKRGSSFRTSPNPSQRELNLPHGASATNLSSSGPNTPTGAAPTSAKSKGFKIDLTATLLDLGQFRRTVKPAWTAGKLDLDHRTRVALEMLDTEQTYFLGISVLLENYMKPLLEYCKHEPKIAEADVTKIFGDGSLEAIHVLNTKLLEQIEDRLQHWEEKPELGDIFDKFAPLLKPYSRYGSKYEECLQHVTELQQKNHKFKKVFDFYDDHAFRFQGLRLKDYLIMPVQRVPRYNMLLRDLLKNTPEGHSDLANLQSACKKVEEIASAVNEGIRQAESQTKMAAIIERGGGFENLLKNYRRFIKSGMVPLLIDLNDRKKGAKKDGELMLFNDIVVSATFVNKKAEPRDYSLPLPLIWISKDLDEEQIAILTAEDLNPALGWTIRGPETTWLVCSKDTMDRNMWFNTFADILQVSQEELASGERKGKYDFAKPGGVYDGGWLDGGFYGKGTYVRHDGVLFDGHWDYRFQAGFGLITSDHQTLSGWRSNRPTGDVEAYNDEFGIFTSSQLADRDWSLLLTGAREVTYKKGESIIAQGKENSNLYRIKSGNCRVEKTNDAGDRIQLATMGPKAMFGDTAVVPSMKMATADVVADSDVVEIYQIEVPIVYEILKSNPGLAMRFYKQISVKLSQRLRNLHAPPQQKADPNKKSKSPQTKPKDINNGAAGAAGGAGAGGANAAAAGAGGIDAEEDHSFCQRFDLPSTEIVIKEIECMSKGMVRKYGMMYISQNFVCFEATVFGMSSQEVIAMSKITSTEVKNKKELRLILKNKKYIFNIEQSIEEVHSLINSLRQSKSDQLKEKRLTDELGLDDSGLRRTSTRTAMRDAEGITLSKPDWQLLQMGFRLVTFKKDEDVIKEGAVHQRIYQIAKGKCRIQITHPLEGPKVVGEMEPGALFGEMSFLEGGSATASVIADSDSVEMYILEGHFINIVFVKHPDLSGRFYAYLASVIAERLNSRERAIAKAAKKSKKEKEKEKAKEKADK